MSILNYITMSLYGNTISGIIHNDKKQPIEFANITVFKTNDSLPVSTTLSDSLGAFTFSNLAENNYSIEVSYLGYVTDTIKNISIKDRVDIINIENLIDTIIVQNNAIQLNEIQLKLSSTTLNEVQVIATKPIYERKTDRIIFNVENSVYSQGSDAMQALSKAPRVQVNNNEIKVAGRGDAAVLINDRLVRMSGEELSQYLKSIPSNDIQSIEVIPNPPAKYDAQGSALINIVLKKNKKQGYNGNVTGSFTQAQYQGGSLGITFNHTKNKVSFNSSVTNLANKDYSEESNILQFNDQIWRDTAINKKLYNTLSGRFELTININDKNTVGINYKGSWNNVFRNEEDIITKVKANNDVLLKNIEVNASINRKFFTHILTTYYTIEIDTLGKKLYIGFDFINSYRNINRTYSNDSYYGLDSLLILPQENTTGKQKSYISAINFDMEHPAKYGYWKYGIKSTYVNIRSDNKQNILQLDNTYKLDSTRSSLFDYKEYNQAMYISFSKTIKKVDIELGLRLEYTQLKGVLISKNQVNKQQYIRPFPSLMLQYKHSERHQLFFSVDSRINRPSFSQLNPFRYYISQYSYSEGNPYLQPLWSYGVSLEYIHKKNYSFSLYYNYTKNNSNPIQYTDTTNKTNFWRWESYGRNIHDLGTYNRFDFNIKNRWDINVYIDLYIDFFKSPYLYKITKRVYWGMELVLNNDFIFDKNSRFTGNLNFNFLPPGRSRGEKTMRGYYQLDLGLKAKLLKNKQLVIGFNANNIFKSKQSNGYLINNTGLYSSYTNYYNNRAFILSISYSFGNRSIKSKSKQIENVDVNRIR